MSKRQNKVFIKYLHIVVFNEHGILHFCDNAHLSKHYPIKVLQNYFDWFK